MCLSPVKARKPQAPPIAPRIPPCLTSLTSQGHLNDDDKQLFCGSPSHTPQANCGISRHEITPSEHLTGPHCATATWPALCLALFEQMLTHNGEFRKSNGYKIQQITVTKLKDNIHSHQVKE